MTAALFHILSVFGNLPENRSLSSDRSRGISYWCVIAGILSPLGICAKRTKVIPMPAVATGSMIRREIGEDQICLLTLHRPDSGAKIFDAATLDELNEHLHFVENQSS